MKLMRLWSLHPKYLDVKGLLAIWREGLLAKKILSGATKAYINHPQLNRFKEALLPCEAIDFYLRAVYEEALKRNYGFNGAKINLYAFHELIPVTRGQVIYEKIHLKKKLIKRKASRLSLLEKEEIPHVHPSFILVEGEVENWEIIRKN